MVKNIKLFIRFLKIEKIYYIFQNEVITYMMSCGGNDRRYKLYEKHKKNLLSFLISQDNCYNTPIDAAFFWMNTKKGHTFWSDINYRWYKYYNNY